MCLEKILGSIPRTSILFDLFRVSILFTLIDLSLQDLSVLPLQVALGAATSVDMQYMYSVVTMYMASKQTLVSWLLTHASWFSRHQHSSTSKTHTHAR